jgi:hypothetical protein
MQLSGVEYTVPVLPCDTNTTHPHTVQPDHTFALPCARAAIKFNSQPGITHHAVSRVPDKSSPLRDGAWRHLDRQVQKTPPFAKQPLRQPDRGSESVTGAFPNRGIEKDYIRLSAGDVMCSVYPLQTRDIGCACGCKVRTLADITRDGRVGATQKKNGRPEHTYVVCRPGAIRLPDRVLDLSMRAIGYCVCARRKEVGVHGCVGLGRPSGRARVSFGHRCSCFTIDICVLLTALATGRNCRKSCAKRVLELFGSTAGATLATKEHPADMTRNVHGSRRRSEHGCYPPYPTVDPRTGDGFTCGFGLL